MSWVNALLHGRETGILTSPHTPADSAAVSAQGQPAAQDKPTKNWRPDLSAWFALHQ
jgi:hypothetical protein